MNVANSKYVKCKEDRYATLLNCVGVDWNPYIVDKTIVCYNAVTLLAV
jgi:hypothetical protein